MYIMSSNENLGNMATPRWFCISIAELLLPIAQA